MLVGSFNTAAPGQTWSWGVDNWVRAFSDPQTLSALWMSFLFSVVRLIPSLTLSVIVAWLIARTDMFNNAPHPNAARLFVNWIASKEGLEVYSRARGGVPTRKDINAAAYLPAAVIPQEGVDYFDSYNWDFVLNTKEKIRLRMKELLGR